MGLEKYQEDLGKETLLAEKLKKEKISSGIREFDEMIGGGFTPSSVNLIQESLGCGGDILMYCIARANLNLSNKVLIIFSDPLSKYLVERLKKFDPYFSPQEAQERRKEEGYRSKGFEHGENLYILDLVKLSERDISLMEDKHELKLKITTAINQMMEEVTKSGDDFADMFIFYFSLNPYLLKLGNSTLDLIYENLINALKGRNVQIMLMQKRIISNELKAKIQSLCHLVCDLNAENVGGITEHSIKILKHAGTIHDIKAEPYFMDYDRRRDRYSFLIRGAFLTSFETMRNLLKYQQGAIFLATEPYLIAPVNYFNMLLEMPIDISKEEGKGQILEKSQAIGRNLTQTTQKLYYLTGIDLLKATLRSFALFGFGNSEIDYHESENLLITNFSIQKDFHERSYKLFIKGFLQGIIKASIERNIRTLRIIRVEDPDSDEKGDKNSFKIEVRLAQEE